MANVNAELTICERGEVREGSVGIRITVEKPWRIGQEDANPQKRLRRLAKWPHLSGCCGKYRTCAAGPVVYRLTNSAQNCSTHILKHKVGS